MTPPIKHYLQFADFRADEYAYLFARAALIKRKFKAYEKHLTQRRQIYKRCVTGATRF